MGQIDIANPWGRAASSGTGGLDQQRGDLFRVQIALPSVLGLATAWNTNIQVALTKFPFPNREREMIGTKYLNQTNFQMGAEAPLGTIELPVRFAIGQKAMTLLEQWWWMHSHPNGGVALTSAIKCSGLFFWLIPALEGLPVPMSGSASSLLTAGEGTLMDGASYFLEGVMMKGWGGGSGDMESSNGLVSVNATLQCDRYYPIDPTQLSTSGSGLSIA